MVKTQAYQFAKLAHAAVGQVRKYTHEPYINHPVEVAQIVQSVGSDDNMIAAAYLHDVCEDTPISVLTIDKMFGQDIGMLVFHLTDISQPQDGNRATRKAIDRDHLARAPARAQTIKVADLISNSQDIVQNDPKFAQVYIKEKQQLLNVLTKADARLIAQAQKIINNTGIAV